ncbi:MAG: TIM barrel protein, partial [Anaerolineaceae bacterium]|nr:TIM barrel protein [Anaerolineaceae bacterium]
QLAEIGGGLGCRFALENLPRGQMGDDMDMLRRIVDEVDSPCLGLNYDCGHANLGDGATAVLEAGGERIIGTHIHDNNGQADDHLVPGLGSIPMEAVCRGLVRHGYSGDFTLELMGSTDEIRSTCDGPWWERFNHWVNIASGLAE